MKPIEPSGTYRKPLLWSVSVGGLLALAAYMPACGAAPAAEPRVTLGSKCPSASVAASPPPQPLGWANPVDTVARELVMRINAKDAKGIVALFDGEMAKTFPVAETEPFVRGIVDGSGVIVGVERLEGGSRGGAFKLKAERAELRLELSLGMDDKIAGMRITKATPEPPVEKSTASLGLPFRGQWLVYWGGDRAELNPHVGHKSQRRATDLVMVDADGKTHRGDGKKNEDYLGYGQDVLAVADGTVVTVIDGVPDNVPGELNPSVLGGNTVTVKHSDSLFSLYAHLQPGKMRVRVGAKVVKGTVLGACGNSGNSSEPHLHFQLQDALLFDRSWGVEPVFQGVRVVRDGKVTEVATYTWLKDDRVGEPTKK
jgi:hypothetical protein